MTCHKSRMDAHTWMDEYSRIQATGCTTQGPVPAVDSEAEGLLVCRQGDSWNPFEGRRTAVLLIAIWLA
jgi:hypothetical protein